MTQKVSPAGQARKATMLVVACARRMCFQRGLNIGVWLHVVRTGNIFSIES
jgi:hypothetical protein